MRVIQGAAARARQSAIEAAYDHFRVDRQGNLVSGNTLDHYHYLVGPFFDWLREERPDVQRFEALDVNVVRDYRLALTQRVSERTGRPLEPATILDAHRLLITFLRWAEGEEYPVDQRILRLKAPKVPDKEPTLYHITQLRKILAACDSRRAQEDLTVRILVGSGVRESEVCGIALRGPDGLSDLGARVVRMSLDGTSRVVLRDTLSADGMSVGRDGGLWYTDSSDDRIGRMGRDGVAREFVLQSGRDPFDIVAGPDGNGWFTESADRIGRITPSGAITEFPLPSGSIPRDIVVGPDRALWFTEFGLDRIGRMTVAGRLTEYALPWRTSWLDGRAVEPYGIAVGADRRVWFTEQQADRIGRLDRPIDSAR